MTTAPAAPAAGNGEAVSLVETAAGLERGLAARAAVLTLVARAGGTARQ